MSEQHKGLYDRRLIHIIVWTGVLLPSLIKAGTPRLPGLFIQISALLLLGISLLEGLRRRGWGIAWSAIDLPVLGFIPLAAFSSIFVSYHHNAVRCLILVTCYVLFYVHMAKTFSIRDIETLFWGMVGMGVVQSLIGFYQAFLMHEVRITGTFYNPNHLAAFLACLCMLIIARMAFHPPFRTQWMPKAGLVGLMGIALFLTGSRGGLLALAGGAVGFVLCSRARWKVLSVLMVAFVLFIFIPNPLMVRIMEVGRADVYAYSRWSMWKGALAMLRDHPLLGVGIGNFPFYSFMYAFPVEGTWARYARVARYAHNELLHVGAEMGIPGILMILFLLFIVFRECLKKEAGLAGMHGEKKALLVGMMTLLAHSMVDFIFHIPPTVFLLLLMLVWVRQIRIIEIGRKPLWIPLVERRSRAAVVASLVVVAALAWIPIREYIGFRIFDRVEGIDPFSDIRDIERAVRIDFGCAPYHNSLGGAYFKMFGLTRDPDFLEKGLSEAGLAQALNPNDHHFPLSLGMGYLNLYEALPAQPELVTRAEAAFRRCLLLAPYLHKGFSGLGRALFHQKRYRDARDAFEQVVRLEPYCLSGYYWLGLTLEALGDRRAACTEYEEILRIRGLGLEGKAHIPYEKELIDFDLRTLYPKLESMGCGTHAYDGSQMKVPILTGDPNGGGENDHKHP
ncbi:MAG: O-antigen ligase family protein [bacterium]